MANRVIGIAVLAGDCGAGIESFGKLATSGVIRVLVDQGAVRHDASPQVVRSVVSKTGHSPIWQGLRAQLMERVVRVTCSLVECIRR